MSGHFFGQRNRVVSPHRNAEVRPPIGRLHRRRLGISCPCRARRQRRRLFRRPGRHPSSYRVVACSTRPLVGRPLPRRSRCPPLLESKIPPHSTHRQRRARPRRCSGRTLRMGAGGTPVATLHRHRMVCRRGQRLESRSCAGCSLRPHPSPHCRHRCPRRCRLCPPRTTASGPRR